MAEPRVRSRIVRYALLAAAVLVAAWLVVTAKHFIDVDDCLDRGGAWNRDLDKCEM